MTSTITERQRINTSSAVKVPCKAATTANVTLSGEQTIDGVSCVTNDRVLVKNQTTVSENGIWLVDTSAWKRARDWDGAFDVKQGTFVYVTGGTNSGFWYVTTSTDPIIPGTTSVAIAQASSQLLTFSAFIQTLLDDANLAAMLASMGLSSDMQTFLQTANDATARTALGAVGGFAPYEQGTPNMTVRVDSGKIIAADGTLTDQVAQNTGTITAPATNPRIDRVILNPSTGAVSVVTGTEAASPTAPAITAGYLPICQISLTTSTTAITNSMITDERAAVSNMDYRYTRVLDRDVTQTEVVNTTTETSVYSYTVPANTLGTSRSLRLILIGDYLNNTGAATNLIYRVTLGTTDIVLASISIPSSALRKAVQTTTLITAASSASAQVGYLHMIVGTDANVPFINASMVENSTTNLELSVKVDHPTASANLSFRCHSVFLELL